MSVARVNHGCGGKGGASEIKSKRKKAASAKEKEGGNYYVYLSVSVKVSRRIGGRKKSHAFRIQINAREMHQRLLNDFVTCELVTD